MSKLVKGIIIVACDAVITSIVFLTIHNFALASPVINMAIIANASGYFGTNTLATVATFQCAQDIICYGDQVTTGYGSVGPRTRGRSGCSIIDSYAQSQLAFTRASF